MKLARSLRKRANRWLAPRRSCCFCGWKGWTFEPFGVLRKTRRLGTCPSCNSRERHRFAFHLLDGRLGHGHRTLHVAPEGMIEQWLRRHSAEYLSIDADGRNAMRAMDLTRLELPDSSITLLFCSHVLEHIQDDAAAFREIARVLSPGGLAVILVPIGGDRTQEDPAVRTPAQRLARYLQEDHVRLYGLDIAERIAAAGLSVEIARTSDLAPELVRREALDACWFTKEIFLARKS